MTPIHPCFGSPHHLTEFDVWDCAYEFQAFGMTVMPTLAEERIEMAPAVPIEVRRLIMGGDASVVRRPIAELRNTAFFKRPVEKLREKIHEAKETSSEEDKPSDSATT